MNRADRRAALAAEKSKDLAEARKHNPTVKFPDEAALTAVQKWQARRDKAIERFMHKMLREGAL